MSNYQNTYPWKDIVSRIYEFRRNDALNDALLLSRSAHAQYPDVDDVTKAYGWTLCSICKQAIANKQFDLARAFYENEYKTLTFNDADEFVDTLNNSFISIAKQVDPFSGQIESAIKESKDGNPKSGAEKMLALLQQHAIREIYFEEFGWAMYRYMNVYDGNPGEFPLFELCLRSYNMVCGKHRTLLHSCVLNAILKLSSKTDFDFNKYFFETWGPENLRFEDFQSSTREGKTYPSFFYRICNYYVERDLFFDIEYYCSLTGKNRSSVADILRKGWFWKLYRQSQNGKGDILWSMFSSYNEYLSKYGPSEWHSNIMNLANRCMTEQDAFRLLPFFFSWGQNFREADWKPSVGKDGKEYAPLACQVIKASFEALNTLREKKAEHIDFLISAFITSVEKDPSDEWMKRNLGRLYNIKGDKTNAEIIYQGLSKILYDKYYYWQEFAQIVDEPEVKAGMLAKALLIESNEDFIGDIRLDFASYLITVKNPRAAAIELDRYYANRLKNGWRIPEKYSSLKQSIADIPAPKGNNLELYQLLAVNADEFVYKELPWEDVVIAEAWKTEDNKQYVMFTDGNGHNLKARRKFHRLLKDAHVGQSFQIKYEPDSNKLLLIKASSNDDWSVIPEVYAYVEYVNNEKNVVHTITSDNKPVFFHFDPAKPVRKNSFVKIRFFEKENKDKGSRANVVTWRSCMMDEALPHFKNKVVVVDDINPSKDLFHFILGCGMIGGIIRYSETDFRPEIGDFIKIHYCYSTDKSGKRVVSAIDVEQTDEVAEGMVFTTTGFVDIKIDSSGRQFGFINDCYVPEALTYDPACEGKVEAKVLNIQKGREKVFSIRAVE